MANSGLLKAIGNWKKNKINKSSIRLQIKTTVGEPRFVMNEPARSE